MSIAPQTGLCSCRNLKEILQGRKRDDSAPLKFVPLKVNRFIMPLWKCLIGGVLVFGQLALGVGLINRLHGLPWSHAFLGRVRQMLAGMFLLLWLFTFFLLKQLPASSSGLLNGSELPGTACIPIGLSVWGYLLMLGALLRHWTRRLPSQVLETREQILDVSAELGYRPSGPGPFSMLLQVPGNQQFQLALEEKTLRIDRLPAALDGLSLLHVSDWHFSGPVGRDYFDFVASRVSACPVDLVCFTGDLIDDLRLLDWIDSSLNTLQGRLGRYFILGNHDRENDADQARNCLTRHGWIDLAGQTVLIPEQACRIAIAGDEWPWMGAHPEFPDQADLRLLLSHSPDNIRYAKSQQVDLMLSGHNHGGQVRIPGAGPILSPSWSGSRYASGIFWESPTLLHVSRGLSGMHPLRLNCRPEVTRLILRSPK
jgi:predicted MPP superfamily phosphohydrolase